MVGPTQLDPAKVTAAIDTLWAKIEQARTTGIQVCNNCLGDNNVVDFDPEELELCRNCGYELPALYKTKEELAEVVNDWVAEWPPDHRDAASRDLPARFRPADAKDVEHVVVFAGEMTWGDEPAGSGYEYLKLGTSLGICELLGIE